MKKMILLLSILFSIQGFSQVNIDQVVLTINSSTHDSAYIQYTSFLDEVFIIRKLVYAQNGCNYDFSFLEFRGVLDTISITKDTIIDVGYSAGTTDYFSLVATWDTNPPNTSNTRVFMDTFLYDNCSTTSIAEQDLNFNFSLFPNPAQTYFQIQTEDFNPIQEIQVFDAKGQQVALYRKRKKRYSTAHYSTGIYFIKVKTTYGERTKKLIITKP